MTGSVCDAVIVSLLDLCVYHSDDALHEDADTSKLTNQNMLLKRLLNTNKTGDQPVLATSTPTSASQSRLSEV